LRRGQVLVCAVKAARAEAWQAAGVWGLKSDDMLILRDLGFLSCLTELSP